MSISSHLHLPFVAQPPERAAAALAAPPWWVTPHGLTLGFLIPVILLVAGAGSLNLPGLTVRGHIYLSEVYVAMGVLILACVGLGGWLGSHIVPPSLSPTPSPHYLRAGFLVGSIALLAYLYWFRDFLLHPAQLFQVLTGAYKPEREEIGVTTGVTSLVNFAPLFFSIYIFFATESDEKLQRRFHILAAILLVLTLFRVYVWSERLALIEALLPFLIAGGLKLTTGAPHPIKRWAVVVGPFAALPLLVFYFGVSEYFRSWQSGTYAGKSSFWEFAIGRFASYYYTSLNNGAGVLEVLGGPSFRFDNTLLWLHKFPFGLGELFGNLVGAPRVDFHQFLASHADVEFNNPSGIYAVVYDVGLPLAIVYFFVIAVLAGASINLYRRRVLIGAIAYPILYLSLLEIFRYPYLGSPRAFTWVLGIVITMAVAAVSSQASRIK